jgi:putative spermidine/putrescine transport system substrate-binding protein
MKRSAIFTSTVIAGFAALAVAAPVSAEVAKELHVTHAGGQWGDAIKECVDQYMPEKHGFEVIVESPGGLAKLRAMVESGNITSTLWDAETGELMQEISLGLIEPLDWAKIDPHPMYEEAKHEYGIGTNYYSTVMAWRSDAKAPSNWVEFFDTENFPGKRALPKYASFILPFAILGDGVPADKLFPLDLDRAYKTLNRIKADTIWWEAGAQPPQLLQDNEAQYVISWSGRVVGKDGITVSFKDGMLDTSWFVVAKGADPAEKEAAWIWLREQTDAKAQACIAQYVSYTGPSPDLDALLPQDKLDQFPTTSANKKMQWFTNAQWWYENAESVQKQWEEFLLTQ